MREVNFSIPNVNKASVGITTALYDRRALDCTSTLPLINSLNHLAYLTTSSARIRDILTVDGGIERLICILKRGRSKDMMDMWKWNLAFQCVVNIGVRGTENVRTRVVEADMVPVIATILENYIRVTEKCRDKSDDKAKDNHHRHRTHDHRSVHKAPSFTNRPNRVEVDQRPNILRWLLPTGLQFQPIATTTTTTTTIIIITGQLRFVTRCLLLPVKLSSLSPQRYDLLMPPTVSCDLFVMSTALPR
ncbi:MYND-type zinc finger protein samB [Colletotrichum spinosum]|uniref:MYND-type zinc finger protein samB n=1 Tax=Colletotrichum spinosum TaxID=1347390 RepID=A0A4R8PRI7_9PEZI|nr:MYND-type zinc finger protein samB [Colletotrichum spinosum]